MVGTAHVPVTHGVLLFDGLQDVAELTQVGMVKYWLVSEAFDSMTDGNESGRVKCGTRKGSSWW